MDISNFQRSIIEAHEVNKYNDKEVFNSYNWFSKGESMSALYRMLYMNIDIFKIKPKDQIILSAKAIPGNEVSVSEIINHLFKSWC